METSKKTAGVTVLLIIQYDKGLVLRNWNMFQESLLFALVYALLVQAPSAAYKQTESATFLQSFTWLIFEGRKCFWEIEVKKNSA